MDNKEAAERLIEKASKDKKVLAGLKNVAVLAQDYEFAAKLREIEKELFPRTEDDIAAHLLAHDAKLAMSMVGLGFSDEEAWLTSETFRVLHKKKGKFDLADAAKLLAKRDLYFKQ